MRVFVAGAEGMLGTSLVPYLRKSGHVLSVHARQIENGIKSDLSCLAEASRCLDAASPDVIINLVALTDVDSCERDPKSAYNVNVGVVKNLVYWIQKENRPCHMIQLSTDHVYDEDGSNDEGNISLLNCYAQTKYAGEIASMSVPSTVLRTNFFGPSCSFERASLSDWLLRSMVHGEQISVFDDVIFSPLSFSTLVKMIELVVRKQQSGIFNLGSKDGMSKADFAFKFAKEMDLSVENVKRSSVETLNLYAPRPKRMCMNSSKFEHTFSVQLPSLRDEIVSMRDAYGKQNR